MRYRRYSKIAMCRWSEGQGRAIASWQLKVRHDDDRGSRDDAWWSVTAWHNSDSE